MKKRLFALFAAAYLLGLLIFLPAALVNTLLRQQSDGQLSLHESSGTLWAGQGRLSFQVQGAARPLGMVSWKISPVHLLLATLQISISQELDGAQGQALLMASPQTIELHQIDVVLPAAVLSTLSPSLMALDPGGNLRIRSENFKQNKAQGISRFDGAIVIDWERATLLQGREAGTYQISIRGNGSSLDGELATRDGALILDGQGNWRTGLPFKMNGHVRLSPDADTSRVMPLFRSLCPNGGSECAISVGYL
ncbi:MAG: ral secretion pathway protein [Proteobacteria bacterium]|nr:ral secretion pathway protein [Pseudomonadota bacterium]